MKREYRAPRGEEHCAAAALLLTGYVAGELDGDQAASLREHLARCPRCREELAREQVLRRAVAGLPLVKCPPRLARRLRDLPFEVPRPARPTPRFRWPALVGSAAAAAALALLLRGPGPAPTPARTESPVTATVTEPAWTEAEIAGARDDLKRGLLLTARILNHTERSTVKEVFGNTLPRTLNRSLKTLMTTPEGGQG